MASETEYTIKARFTCREPSLRLLCLVEKFIQSLGPVELVPRKTQVASVRNLRFAWVWLPQVWIRTQPQDRVTLRFGLDHPIKHPKIKQSLEPYPGRFAHDVVTTHSSDVDGRMNGWLGQAYELGGPGRRSRN